MARGSPLRRWGPLLEGRQRGGRVCPSQLGRLFRRFYDSPPILLAVGFGSVHAHRPLSSSCAIAGRPGCLGVTAGRVRWARLWSWWSKTGPASEVCAHPPKGGQIACPLPEPVREVGEVGAEQGEQGIEGAVSLLSPERRDMGVFECFHISRRSALDGRRGRLGGKGSDSVADLV